MPINSLPAPCYADKGDRTGRHYDEPAVVSDQLPGLCVVAECSGLPGAPCGELMGDDDEFAVLHFETEQEAREFAVDVGWYATPAGEFRCQDCGPDADTRND